VLVWSALDVARMFPGAVWLLIIAMTCITGISVARMPGFPVSFSLSDAFTITAALLFGPGAGALTVACDALVMSWQLSREKRTPVRVLFNVTAPALSLWIAAGVFFELTAAAPVSANVTPPAPIALELAIFATVYFVLNATLIAGAIVIGREASLRTVWRRHLLPLWWTQFTGTSIAGLVLLMIRAGLATLQTLLVALPLIVALVTAATIGVTRMRRRSAEFAALRSYAAALRSTGDAVVLADGEGLITFMNAAAEQLTGWSRKDALGRPVDEVLDLQPSADEEPPDAGADGRSEPARSYRLVTRQGTTCPIEHTHAWIRDEDGVAIGVIRTFRDITPRLAIERERLAVLGREQEARAAAEAANRTKDEFLATLSHELRTPATAITGWITLLQSGRLDEAGAQKALAAIDRSARAHAAVLNDLLDSSRIVRGALRLDLRRVSLERVIQDSVETVEPAAHARGITLVAHVEQDLPTIDADPERLRQVFWNLLSNAVKFTPEGGTVTLSATLAQDVIRAVVTDTGCGIPDHFLPFVFDRFRQAQASDDRPYGGLGLGLSIVRHLVEAHGGTVSAASDGPGRGAQFTVILPASSRRRATDAPPLHAPAGSPRASNTFEDLIVQMLRAEPAHDGLSLGVLRADAYTWQPVTSPAPRDATDREVEARRRILAMAFARTLEAHGIPAVIPARWRDRRDPAQQTPTPGGRRQMDTGS
jgi:PAS domain S-box-containing protein